MRGERKKGKQKKRSEVNCAAVLFSAEFAGNTGSC